MTELARLKFYATQPHPCSYLPEEQATTLFLDPSQPMDTQLYASLSEVGFRRSGDHLYRPHCQHCTACIAARIPVAGFSPNRQQRRILKRNAELQVIRKRPSFNEEYYDLYRRYIEQRHADGDMYPPSRDQFATFLVRDLPFCCFFEFRLHGRLLAIAVTDVLPNGLSAVYTFYDPDEEQRSLGRYAILWQIAETERLGLQAVADQDGCRLVVGSMQGRFAPAQVVVVHGGEVVVYQGIDMNKRHSRSRRVQCRQ